MQKNIKLKNINKMKAKFILAALMVAAVMTSCSDGGKKQLFNGKDLTGWVCVLDANSNVPTSEVYGVKDGNIHIVGKPFGYMRTAQKYGDYKLHVEWRWIGEGTNSGLFQRVQDGDKVWPEAIECQLCAGKAGDYVMLGGAKIAEVECVGDFPVKDRVKDCEKPVGEWNTAEIICQGKNIKVYINGEFQNECTGDHSEGYIALQSEGGPIEFRNIYITDIK